MGTSSQAVQAAFSLIDHDRDWVNPPKAINRSPSAIVNGRVAAVGNTDYHEFLKARYAQGFLLAHCTRSRRRLP